MSTTVTKNPDAKTLKLESVFYFGKYKGKTVEEVMRENPGWLLWAQDNVAYIQFPMELIAMFKEAAAAPNPEFKFNPGDLFEHSKVLQDLSKGLDAYGRNGVRQVHNIPDETNVHQSLTYFIKLASFLQQALNVNPKITIEKSDDIVSQKPK